MKTRDELFEEEIRPAPAKVPHWGDIFVRQLSLPELIAVETLKYAADRIVKAVLYGLVDESGRRIYEDGDFDRVKAGAKPEALMATFDKIKELANIETAVSEAEKN